MLGGLCLIQRTRSGAGSCAATAWLKVHRPDGKIYIKVKNKGLQQSPRTKKVLPSAIVIISDLQSGLLLLRIHQYLLDWLNSSWGCYQNTDDILAGTACLPYQYCPGSACGLPSWSCPCFRPAIRRMLILKLSEHNTEMNTATHSHTNSEFHESRVSISPSS